MAQWVLRLAMTEPGCSKTTSSLGAEVRYARQLATVLSSAC